MVSLRPISGEGNPVAGQELPPEQASSRCPECERKVSAGSSCAGVHEGARDEQEEPRSTAELHVGEVVNIVQTRLVQRAQARARSRCHHKTSEPHLYFPRRRRAFQAKGYNVHASESAPTGARGLCPACGGETSIRLIAPTNAHGVERRTFECKQCHARQAFIVARENGTTHLIRH